MRVKVLGVTKYLFVKLPSKLSKMQGLMLESYKIYSRTESQTVFTKLFPRTSSQTKSLANMVWLFHHNFQPANLRLNRVYNGIFGQMLSLARVVVVVVHPCAGTLVRRVRMKFDMAKK